jgi:NADP-dependent 3-hydroxy acid dehydrogenase YdfG
LALSLGLITGAAATFILRTPRVFIERGLHVLYNANMQNWLTAHKLQGGHA